MPFGQLMGEYVVAGWVHQVSFSPSGCRLIWVAHDSSMGLVDANEDNTNAQTLRSTYLPFTTVKWITENSAVAAGHDCCPVLVTVKDGKLVVVCKLDVPAAQKATAVNSALKMFQTIDRHAVSQRQDLQLGTLHQNMITQILPHSGGANNVLKFTTCSTDGLIALWDLKETIEFCRSRNNTAVAH